MLNLNSRIHCHSKIPLCNLYLSSLLPFSLAQCIWSSPKVAEGKFFLQVGNITNMVMVLLQLLTTLAIRPGPPTIPVLGNLHEIPKKGSYLKYAILSYPRHEGITKQSTNRFTEWAKQYGGLYSLKIGTGTAIVITDRRIVKELVDRKSSKYSNRPESYVAHTITGGSHLLAMQYGPLWRSFRKLIHQHFMESMVEKSHVKVQNAEAVQMVRDFCLWPEKHMLHPKRYSNSITMSLG